MPKEISGLWRPAEVSGRAASRMRTVIGQNRGGIGGKLFNRGDRAAVTAAARDSLAGVERQFEIAVRTCLESAHAREVDQPRPVYPHDIERRQPRFLGGQGAPDEVIDAVGKTVLDIISGRTDPENVARFDADAR